MHISSAVNLAWTVNTVEPRYEYEVAYKTEMLSLYLTFVKSKHSLDIGMSKIIFTLLYSIIYCIHIHYIKVQLYCQVPQTVQHMFCKCPTYVQEHQKPTCLLAGIDRQTLLEADISGASLQAKTATNAILDYL